jgi:putative glycosyltransferase (TIGR04372 family)
VVPKFLRRKFAGVQQPLGRWILRHVAEFIVLSPAILVTWLWLKLRRKEVLIVGQFSNNISNYVSMIEPELRRRLRDKSDLKRVIVLNLSVDPNIALRFMYDKIVKIFGEERRIQRRVLWWASLFGLTFRIPSQMFSDVGWKKNFPSVSLSKSTREKGAELLKKLEVARDQQVVCYATRSDSYYQAQRLHFVQKSQKIRNPNEDVYFDVGRYLFENGFRVFRMGKFITNSIRSDVIGIVDYATRFQSDDLDLFLLYHCKFLLNGATGIFWLRSLFGKQSVHSDIYDLRTTFFLGDLTLLQKVYLERENRFATFKEMLLMPGYSEEKHQERLGVRLIKNTVEEIKAVCDEMNARIDGTWVTTEEDEELQRRYQELIVKYSNKPEWNGGGRIGAQFLRENQDLLRE